ncbi:cystatin-F [Pelobates fuscus]|uniref:cystatin-F n=1 Tax=Pelobates fuscus TaxID=191477 RepID=UPI002FE4D31D
MLPICVSLLLICILKNDFMGSSYVQGFNMAAVQPGFPRNISTNNEKVKAAAQATVYKYNNMSNDKFLFKELEIQRAMIQIVKGTKYMLQTKIARTVCTKNESVELDNCDIQQDNTLKKAYSCYSEVWNITWMHVIKVLVLHCKEIPDAQLQNYSGASIFWERDSNLV